MKRRRSVRGANSLPTLVEISKTRSRERFRNLRPKKIPRKKVSALSVVSWIPTEGKIKNNLKRIQKKKIFLKVSIYRHAGGFLATKIPFVARSRRCVFVCRQFRRDNRPLCLFKP